MPLETEMGLIGRGNSTTTLLFCGSAPSIVCRNTWAPSAYLIVVPSLD